MPPIPPGPPLEPFFFFRELVTSASVVSNRPEIEAAFCNAASHLGGIDNAGFNQVDVFAGGNIVTFVSDAP